MAVTLGSEADPSTLTLSKGLPSNSSGLAPLGSRRGPLVKQSHTKSGEHQGSRKLADLLGTNRRNLKSEVQPEGSREHGRKERLPKLNKTYEFLNLDPNAHNRSAMVERTRNQSQLDSQRYVSEKIVPRAKRQSRRGLTKQ